MDDELRIVRSVRWSDAIETTSGLDGVVRVAVGAVMKCARSASSVDVSIPLKSGANQHFRKTVAAARFSHGASRNLSNVQNATGRQYVTQLT